MRRTHPGPMEIQACFISAGSGHPTIRMRRSKGGGEEERERERERERQGETERENGESVLFKGKESLAFRQQWDKNEKKWLPAGGVLTKPNNQSVSCSVSTDVVP